MKQRFIREFGWQIVPMFGDMDILWLLDLLEEWDGAKKPEQDGKKPGVWEGAFRKIWRMRFAHLHPDVVDMAVEAEWNLLRWDAKTERYERTYPDYWPDRPFLNTDEGREMMRANR